MTKLAKQRELLKQAGYAYSFDREVYYNNQTKKVFSLEFIEDNSADELEECIGENTDGKNWRFYFNAAPSASARQELEIVLG